MNHADLDDCPLCGGCGEVTITPHDGSDGDADSYGCPRCIQAERDAEIDELKAKNAALVGLLVQCALAANTLRIDFERYANHSGFNDEFVSTICAIAGVHRNLGYGNAEYQSQQAALASVKGGV